MFTTKKHLNGDELGISMKDIHSEKKSETKSENESASHKASPLQDKAEVEYWLYGEQMCNTATELSQNNEGVTDEKEKLVATELSSNELSSTEHAQQQLVHALLLQQKDTDAETSVRIEKVMSQLSRQEELSTTNSTSKNNNVIPLFRRWVSIAASVLVLVGFSFTLMLPSNEAIAAMDKVIETFSEMAGRVYDVKVETAKQGKKGSKHKQKSNGPERQDDNRKNKKSSFSGGKLYLSGSEQFVLIANNQHRKGKITGSNGVESWSIGGKGKVKIETQANSQAKTNLPLAAKSAELTFMNIPEMLNALKQSYHLTIEYDQQANNIAGLWSKITLEKIDNQTKGVKELVLFFNPDTHVIQQMIFDKVHLQGDPSLKKVTMTLLSTAPIESNWFNYQTHL